MSDEPPPQPTRLGAGDPGPATQALVAHLLDEQRRRWQAGERPPVEDCLKQQPACRDDPEVVLDLIYNEILLREGDGESPQLDEYQQRFPDLALRLALLFEVERALLDPSLRSSTGEESGQPAAASASAWPSTQRPARASPRDTARPAAPSPAQDVAGYELLGLLGEGGMGVVYKARQVGLKRVVALKMLRPGQADAEAIARFRAEAEAVARLQHPNIVQVHEVGERGGRPFFSMEYVEGPSLAQHLGGAPQQPRAAARLVEALARAVHFAHQANIIHRDLKPANVLLQPTGAATLSGSATTVTAAARGMPGEAAGSLLFIPKVTDFGLAKCLDEQGHTHTGAIMGTPSYMAPEQASGSKEIGPAVDVYALGAILYECLTGRPPFKGASLMETLYQVRFNEPVSPRQLQPRVPRDLETACLKCLEKDPRRRYPNALALADDLRRFQEGQPLRARPIGLGGRLLRWARRRPAAAALLAVSAAAVLILLVGGWWTSLKLGKAAASEREQRLLAEESLGQAHRAVDQLLAEVADIDLAGVPHMEQRRRRLLLKAVGFYEEFLQKSGSRASVRLQAGRISSRLGDIREMLNEDSEAQQAYARAVALLDEPFGDPTAEVERRRELARAHNSQGVLQKKRGSWSEAERSLRLALELRQRLQDDLPDDLDARRDLADSHYHLAALLARRADGARQAGDDYKRALELLKGLVEQRPERGDYRRDLARTWNNLGILYWQTPGRSREARSAFAQAVKEGTLLVKKFPGEPLYRWDLARAHNNEASRLREKVPLEAKRAYEEARALLAGLARDFPTAPRYRRELAGVQTNLGTLQRLIRRPGEAEVALRQALELRGELVEKFPGAPDYQHELAKTELELASLLHPGRPEQAEQAYRRALASLGPLVKANPGVPAYRTDLVWCLEYLARLLVRRGKLGEPGQGVEMARPGLCPRPLHQLAALARAHAALAGAADCLEEAIGHQKGATGTRARKALAELHFQLAEVRLRQGRHALSAQAARQLPVLAPDRLSYLRAAAFLAQCARLAAGAPELSAGQRRQCEEQYARQGIALLREAFQRRLLKDAGSLRSRSYDPLRGHPEFKQLLASAGKK